MLNEKSPAVIDVILSIEKAADEKGEGCRHITIEHNDDLQTHNNNYYE